MIRPGDQIARPFRLRHATLPVSPPRIFLLDTFIVFVWIGATPSLAALVKKPGSGTAGAGDRRSCSARQPAACPSVTIPARSRLAAREWLQAGLMHRLAGGASRSDSLSMRRPEPSRMQQIDRRPPLPAELARILL